MSMQFAEQALKDRDLDTALSQLEAAVRKDVASAPSRVFLFQLLAVLGQWDRALTQLKVASDIDAANIPMAQMYSEAIRCELLRREVFSGKRSPVLFGDPEQWVALLIESLLRKE